MATIGNVDGVPILDKINNLENKIKNKFLKHNPINDIEQVNESQKEMNPETSKLATWDLRNWEIEPNELITHVNVNSNEQPIKLKNNNNERSL